MMSPVQQGPTAFASVPELAAHLARAAAPWAREIVRALGRERCRFASVLVLGEGDDADVYPYRTADEAARIAKADLDLAFGDRAPAVPMPGRLDVPMVLVIATPDGDVPLVGWVPVARLANPEARS
jgi:hypothetical protein